MKRRKKRHDPQPKVNRTSWREFKPTNRGKPKQMA